LTEAPARRPVMKALDPEAAVPSCFGPFHRVADGSPRVQAPLVAVSPPKGFRVQPLLSSRSSYRSPQLAAAVPLAR
jgi:hypothetical protein